MKAKCWCGVPSLHPTRMPGSKGCGKPAAALSPLKRGCINVAKQKGGDGAMFSMLTP